MIPKEKPKYILCGEANKFYRCVTCDAPCGSEGHYIEEPEQYLEEQDVENKIIHFAEWLTGKHTTELITLYEHFNNKYYENHN